VKSAVLIPLKLLLPLMYRVNIHAHRIFVYVCRRQAKKEKPLPHAANSSGTDAPQISDEPASARPPSMHVEDVPATSPDGAVMEPERRPQLVRFTWKSHSFRRGINYYY
jgi:hypothetical protein